MSVKYAHVSRRCLVVVAECVYSVCRCVEVYVCVVYRIVSSFVDGSGDDVSGAAALGEHQHRPLLPQAKEKLTER